MITIEKNLINCTGCRSCELKCPVDAIKLEPNSEGFIYPIINHYKCIKCDICEKHCHMLNSDKNTLLYKKKSTVGYFGWHKDEQIRANSSSGGAFSAILETYLDDCDIVFGAIYNKTFDYVYCTSASKNDYFCMRKSKYVFSDLMDSYKKAKDYLRSGKKVLFTGNPCQIAGLKSFLNREYKNLLTIDFICHGTPSIKMLDEHVNYVSNKRKVANIDFRSGHFGWVRYSLKIFFDKFNSENYYIKKCDEDFYMHNFLKNYSLRECCYNCQYSNGNHVSDITIADFWGILKYKPELNDEKGISLVIFNNKEIFCSLYQELCQYMHLERLDYQDYKYVYKTHASYPKENRKYFMKYYAEKGYYAALKKWKRKMAFNKIKGLVRKIIPK